MWQWHGHGICWPTKSHASRVAEVKQVCNNNNKEYLYHCENKHRLYIDDITLFTPEILMDEPN